MLLRHHRAHKRLRAFKVAHLCAGYYPPLCRFSASLSNAGGSQPQHGHEGAYRAGVTTWAAIPWYVGEHLARERLRSSLARLALVRRRVMLVVASHTMGIRVRRGQDPTCAFFCPLSNA